MTAKQIKHLMNLQKAREKWRKRERYTTMDSLMDCPYCNRFYAMECNNGFWYCLWRDCGQMISETDFIKVDKLLASKEIAKTLEISLDKAEKLLTILNIYGFGR